jgi:predicted nucleotidyltransferase
LRHETIGFLAFVSPSVARCSRTTVSGWFPVDGDTFVTEEGFIFNVFGYEHPEKRVFAFLKYIPAKSRQLFNVDLLHRTWKYKKTELFRAEKLYTAQNYQAFLQTFRNDFLQYVYFCPFRKKEVISAPLSAIREAYVPSRCLRSLEALRTRDSLQETTLDFIRLLSSESGISSEDFGVHGSVALGMHTSKSDIDIVVYGARNFRKLEKTVDNLVKGGTLSYQSNNRLDVARRFKGRYRTNIFMYNAIRKPEEINTRYGMLSYSAIAPVKFTCTIKDDSEAMFRPAIYKVENYRPVNTESQLDEERKPRQVVSMVGCYRNVARQGDKIRVSGMLERAENEETEESLHQVVVGTGNSEDENICPT